MSLNQVIRTAYLKKDEKGQLEEKLFFMTSSKIENKINKEIIGLSSYVPLNFDIERETKNQIISKMPISYKFTILERGKYALTLNTFLRYTTDEDYFLCKSPSSHSIILDEEDMTGIYPCEYYDSGAFGKNICIDENKLDVLKILPEAKLSKNNHIGNFNLKIFLKYENREMICKNLISAVINARSNNKRVIICDKPDNIILWIAAVEYSLPAFAVKQLSFSTYEYNPDNAQYDIIGVSPTGSAYNLDEYKNKDSYYIFDLVNGYYNDFAPFDELVVSSYNCIVNKNDRSDNKDIIDDYHIFLSGMTVYNSFDGMYQSGYSAFSIIYKNIAKIDKINFDKALAFTGKYGTNEFKAYFSNRLLEQESELYKKNRSYSLSIFIQLASTYKLMTSAMKAQMRNFIVNRIFAEFATNIEENEFKIFYDCTKKICESIEIKLSSELARDENRQKILMLIKIAPAQWKNFCAAEWFCDYVKENNVIVKELNIENESGKYINEVIKASYQLGYGIETAEKIINDFSSSIGYLLNSLMNAEGTILDADADATPLWNYFYDIAVKLHYNRKNEIFRFLLLYTRYSEMKNFLHSIINAAPIEELNDVVVEHYNTFIKNDAKYKDIVLKDLLSIYYIKAQSEDGFEFVKAEKTILEILLAEKEIIEQSEEILVKLTDNLPLSFPSNDNSKTVQNIFEYTESVMQKENSDKIFTLYMIAEISKLQNHKELEDKKEILAKHTKDRKINLTVFSSKQEDECIEKLLDGLMDCIYTDEELSLIFEMFNTSETGNKVIFEYLTNVYIKRGKSDVDFRELCAYLNFVSKQASEESIFYIAQQISSKLNSSQLKKLNENVADPELCGDAGRSIWIEIKKYVNEKSSFFGNVRKFLKRNSKDGEE